MCMSLKPQMNINSSKLLLGLFYFLGSGPWLLASEFKTAPVPSQYVHLHQSYGMQDRMQYPA